MDELLKKALIAERKSKRKSWITSLITLGVIIGLLLVFVAIQQRNEAEQSIIRAKENELEAKRIQDSIKNEARILDVKYKSLVSDYFEMANGNNSDSVIRLLSDTLSRFYLEENMSKEQVKNQLDKHLERFPNDTIYIVETPNILVKEEGVYSYTTVNYKRSPLSHLQEYIAEIRFNSKSEINFIRMYEKSFVNEEK